MHASPPARRPAPPSRLNGTPLMSPRGTLAAITAATIVSALVATAAGSFVENGTIGLLCGGLSFVTAAPLFARAC